MIDPSSPEAGAEVVWVASDDRTGRRLLSTLAALLLLCVALVALLVKVDVGLRPDRGPASFDLDEPAAPGAP